MRPNEGGQILILTALMLVALLGIAALSIDASHMYGEHHRLAAAADAAAKSAAIEVWRGTGGNLQTFAAREVGIQGSLTGGGAAFTPGACGTTATDVVAVCVYNGPISGDHIGDKNYVEVVLSKKTTSFFANVLGWTSFAPGARAVAGIGSSPDCLIALGVTHGTGIDISNPSTGSAITAPSCSVVDGSDFDNRGTITAPSIGVTGTCLDGCTGVTTGVPPPTDPLASLAAPSTADCNGGLPGTDITVGTTGVTLPRGTYHDVTFTAPPGGGTATLTMSGGLYCITGTVSANNPGTDVSWGDTSGVTIYLGPSARLNLNSNHVDITLQAQASATYSGSSYSGIIFYQDRSNANDVVISKNDGNMTVDGAVYFPAASVDMKNENFASSNFCGLFVADALTMNKPAMTMTNTCTDFSGSPFTSVSLAE